MEDRLGRRFVDGPGWCGWRVGACALIANQRLSDSVIGRVVCPRIRHVRACYEVGRTKEPDLAGNVTLQFVIGRDGLSREL